MKVDRLFQKHYFSQPWFVDGTTQFHNMCQRQIARGSRILEIGAGPNNPTTSYLASLGPVVGIDVSDEIRQNHALTETHVYAGGRLPFADGSFDACVTNYVLEHLRDPREHFQEIARVVRGGGVYCFRTPNLYHYVTLISKSLPHGAHQWLANPLRGLPKGAHEPYPTFYRANTLGAIRRFALQAGMRLVEYHLIEKEPSYGRLHSALFFPMMAYERLVNRWESLRWFRSNFLVVLQA